MSSIFRRLLSHKINGNGSGRQLCSAAVVNRELLEPSSPWLMLPPSFIGGGGGGSDMVYNLYSPIKNKVVSFSNRGGRKEADLMRDKSTALAGSSHGWLSLYNFRSRGLFLCNPLSGRRIDLPPYTGKPFRDNEEWRWPEKVIISCSPDREDCRAFMALGTSDRLAFCCPGRSDEWTPLGRWDDAESESESGGDGLRLYNDILYSAAHNKLFASVILAGIVFLRQELEGWDVTDPVHPRLVRHDQFGSPSMPFLFSGCSIVSGEQPDQLFLVRRYFADRETVDARVYRIKINGQLELCSSLDDLVMFVGSNHGFAVKASAFPELKPNSVYFSDSRSQLDEKQYIGKLDYQSRTCSPVYYTSLHHTDLTRQPWFTPTLD